MIVVMVRIPVSSDEGAEGVIERFKRRAGLVDSQPGFRGFELLRGEGELISVTRWETRADLDRWTESQAHSQAHQREGGGKSEGQPHAPASSAPPTATASMSGSVSIYEVAIPSESGG